jgi:uncharacterized membrane protein YfcA
MKSFALFIVGAIALYILGMSVTAHEIPQPWAGLFMVGMAITAGYFLLGRKWE